MEKTKKHTLSDVGVIIQNFDVENSDTNYLSSVSDSDIISVALRSEVDGVIIDEMKTNGNKAEQYKNVENNKPSPKKQKPDDGSAMLSDSEQVQIGQCEDVTDPRGNGIENDPKSKSFVINDEKRKCSQDSDNEAHTNTATSFGSLIRNLSKEGEEECLKFSQVFSEIEKYEHLSVMRLEKLLEEAKELERNLLKQREKLRQGVLQLSQTLTLTP